MYFSPICPSRGLSHPSEIVFLKTHQVHWHGHLPQVLEYKQKKNMTFPTCVRLGITISLKKPPHFCCPRVPRTKDQRAVECSPCHTSDVPPGCTMGWSCGRVEVRYLEKIARWCWLLPRISRWGNLLQNFPAISVSYLDSCKTSSNMFNP